MLLGARIREQPANIREAPHVLAKLPDREIWMAFFDDGEGNVLAITEGTQRLGELPIAA